MRSLALGLALLANWPGLSLAADSATEGISAGSTTSIRFAPGTVAVADADVDRVSRLAEILRGDPKAWIKVLGHLGNLGSSSYEVAISHRRLAAIQTILKAAGIPAARIRTEMIAYEPRVEPCMEFDCHVQSTRVDLILQH
jgi:outer membrane protein OmpA-like peptidoglycan-associated protein